MKKLFNTPEIEIVTIGPQDILTASNGEGTDVNPDW